MSLDVLFHYHDYVSELVMSPDILCLALMSLDVHSHYHNYVSALVMSPDILTCYPRPVITWTWTRHVRPLITHLECQFLYITWGDTTHLGCEDMGMSRDTMYFVAHSLNFTAYTLRFPSYSLSDTLVSHPRCVGSPHVIYFVWHSRCTVWYSRCVIPPKSRVYRQSTRHEVRHL